MKCEYCGCEVDSDAKFCSACGAKINKHNIKEKILEDTNISQDIKNFSSETKGDNISPRSRLVAALLAFFLGGLGIHQFYLGKIGSGICMLLFCWTFIPACIAFVQFIIILCGAGKDKEGKEVVNW